MAIARRDSDHRIAGLDESEHGRQHRGRRAIHHRNVVHFRIAAEMLQAEFPQSISEQGRRELVVVESDVVGRARQMPFQTAEIEHGVTTTFGNL